MRARFADDASSAAGDDDDGIGSPGLGVRHDELDELHGLVVASAESVAETSSCIAATAGGRGECRRMPRIPRCCGGGAGEEFVGAAAVREAALLQRLRSMTIGMGWWGVVVVVVVVVVGVVDAVAYRVIVGAVVGVVVATVGAAVGFTSSATGDVWLRNASRLSTELSDVFRSP